jgi:hypothetical protein
MPTIAELKAIYQKGASPINMDPRSPIGVRQFFIVGISNRLNI